MFKVDHNCSRMLGFHDWLDLIRVQKGPKIVLRL
uniref:Uncharacterized protein n=1 Tax=Lepeophtheirus salmonis TaxID=72036 RepID=A0A0K2VEH9_LEPSM